MSAAMQNIETLKGLRAFAAHLRGAEARWTAKYSDRKHYDKQGFGFTSLEANWNAFKCPTTYFDAHVGTYGSSSCGNAWSADQGLVNKYFVRALNCHKQAILDSMAEFAEADAKELLSAATTELEALQKLLSTTTEQVPA